MEILTFNTIIEDGRYKNKTIGEVFNKKVVFLSSEKCKIFINKKTTLSGLFILSLILMRLQPVFATIYIGNKRHAQCGYRLHSLADKGTYLVEFSRASINNDFVVYLHNHL